MALTTRPRLSRFHDTSADVRHLRTTCDWNFTPPGVAEVGVPRRFGGLRFAEVMRVITLTPADSEDHQGYLHR